MGFFDKLFSGSKQEPKKEMEKSKIRAQFKDEKYFNKEILRIGNSISNFKEDDKEYINQHGKLTPFHYISYCLKLNKKIENYYSLGEDKEVIDPVFQESIENFSQGFSEDYQGYPLLLQMVSLGILLDVKPKEFEKIKDFIYKVHNSSNIEPIWKPDNLIFFLLGDQENKRQGDTPYEKLYETTQLTKEEAENRIKDYLEKWYTMHKDEPWYNTHLRDTGYSGYWAWEVAAVVKKMGLDDTRFKNNPYYPYDMVH